MSHPIESDAPSGGTDDTPFTVEDAGTTSDPADLTGTEPATTNGDRAGAVADEDPVASADATATASAPAAAPASAPERSGTGLSALDDDDIGHVFDQTNGVVEGIEGDSDGTAESDSMSREERSYEDPRFDDAEGTRDDDGVADLRDPNP